MPQKTRGGRVDKSRNQKPRGGLAIKGAADKQPTVNTSAKQTRSPRGRARGGKIPRSDSRSKGAKAAKKAAPAPEPKVDRIGNELCITLVETHLAFVADGNLATDHNTETIALNIMDHIIRPENWDPALTRNVLCAACFYFAGMVTGKQNSASSVAASISWFWEKAITADPHYPLFLKERDVRLMSVDMDEVEQGYALLWDQRDRLQDLVGDYKQSLAQLPTPDVERRNTAEDYQQLDPREEVHANYQTEDGKLVHIVTEDDLYSDDEHEEPTALKDEDARAFEDDLDVYLDPSELDDFDLYVEENE